MGTRRGRLAVVRTRSCAYLDVRLGLRPDPASRKVAPSPARVSQRDRPEPACIYLVANPEGIRDDAAQVAGAPEIAEVGDEKASSSSPVFIGYASQDAAVTVALVETRERRSSVCRIAPRDVKPAALYADAIVRAINEAAT